MQRSFHTYEKTPKSHSRKTTRSPSSMVYSSTPSGSTKVILGRESSGDSLGRKRHDSDSGHLLHHRYDSPESAKRFSSFHGRAHSDPKLQQNLEEFEKKHSQSQSPLMHEKRSSSSHAGKGSSRRTLPTRTGSQDDSVLPTRTQSTPIQQRAHAYEADDIDSSDDYGAPRGREFVSTAK